MQVTTDLVIQEVRRFFPGDRRDNRLMGKLVYLNAKTLDPSTKKLGKIPTVHGGANGLPKTSECLEVTPETFARLMVQAQQQGFFKK
jgi:hypothetical protein